jgi:peptidoglycan-associated lipoprotein
MGCKKQQTTLEEPKPEPTPPPPVVIAEPDTSDNVSFNEADLDAEFRRKVEENMQTIYFDYNSYSLKPVEIEKLGTAGAFLMEYPTSRILVEGHCDERGSSEYNMGLGENRARVVKEYLVNYGIPANRLEITSWGKERPVTPGCVDESCHSRNRRAEYKVLSR